VADVAEVDAEHAVPATSKGGKTISPNSKREPPIIYFIPALGVCLFSSSLLSPTRTRSRAPLAYKLLEFSISWEGE
jgi:hypothetical protein